MSHNTSITHLNYLKKSGVSVFLQDKPNIYYNTQSTNLIKDNIGELKNLNELKLFIKGKKNLGFQGNSFEPIIGEGNDKAKIMLIGDSVEKEENQVLKSISGEPEELLNKMLKAINLKRDQVYTANIVPWIMDKNKEIENKDLLICLPFIQRQIEIIKPNIILLMGSIAAKAILNSNLDISKLRGKWHLYKSINLTKKIECLVTYHPKTLIQFPKEKKFAWEDLKILQKKILNEN